MLKNKYDLVDNHSTDALLSVFYFVNVIVFVLFEWLFCGRLVKQRNNGKEEEEVPVNPNSEASFDEFGVYGHD